STDRWRQRQAGLYVRIVIKAGVVAVVTKADIGLVAKQRSPRLCFYGVAAIGVKVASGVDAVCVIQPKVQLVLRVAVADSDVSEVREHLPKEHSAFDLAPRRQQ